MRINMADYLTNNRNGDMVPIVARALRDCKNKENVELIFPKGDYHFWPDQAYEQYCFISKNDHGLKRIPFPIQNMKSFTIDGCGSEFIFHGRMIPFMLENAADIIVKNLSIDYDRPFFSQGEILASDLNYLDVNIDKTEFPYRVEGDSIYFCSDKWESEGIVNFWNLTP